MLLLVEKKRKNGDAADHVMNHNYVVCEYENSHLGRQDRNWNHDLVCTCYTV